MSEWRTRSVSLSNITILSSKENDEFSHRQMTSIIRHSRRDQKLVINWWWHIVWCKDDWWDDVLIESAISSFAFLHIVFGACHMNNFEDISCSSFWYRPVVCGGCNCSFFSFHFNTHLRRQIWLIRQFNGLPISADHRQKLILRTAYGCAGGVGVGCRAYWRRWFVRMIFQSQKTEINHFLMSIGHNSFIIM